MVIRVERDDLHGPQPPQVGVVDLRVRRSDRSRAVLVTVVHQFLNARLGSGEVVSLLKPVAQTLWNAVPHQVRFEPTPPR